MAEATNSDMDDLEDGELPSSDEEGEVKNNQTLENKESLENHVKDDETSDTGALHKDNIRKRPFESPEPKLLDKDEDQPKKPKIDDSDDDIEEGEIFSDDEEAAYYPQLVKSRGQEVSDKKSFHKRSHDREHSSSPSKGFMRSRSRSPHYGETSYSYHEQRRGRGTGYSPLRNRGQRTGWRRGRGGRGFQHGNDLVGQPIRHEHGQSDGIGKWEGNVMPYNCHGNQPMLTLAVLQSRLNKGLAIFPTPKTNQCLSLDEFNYPAPPQWYLKAVAAYNRRMAYQGVGGGMGGVRQNEITESKEVEFLADNLGYQTKDVNLVGQQPPLEQHNPVEQVTNRLLATELVKPVHETSMISEVMPDNVSSSLTSAHLTVTQNIPVDTTTPNGAVTMATDVVVTPTVTITTLATQEQSIKKTKQSRRCSTRQIKNKNNFIVSIELSKVTVTSTDVTTPTENDEFNYDDYLNQLNDEEEEEPSNDYNYNASNFWIDPKPSESVDQDTGIIESNPLDEDFPAIVDKEEVGGVKDNEQSLRSLVSEDSIDEMVCNEEGKELPGNDRGGKGKGVKRKVKEKMYWTKQQREQEKSEEQQKQQQHQQHQQQRSKQPCKYFLQGYCIHGDNCQYNHDIRREKKKEMCKFYLQDACDKGDDCIFYHGDFPCKYFHARHMCYHGDKCKFSHAPLTIEGYDLLMAVLEPNLKEFVQFPGAPDNNQSVIPSPMLFNDPQSSILGPMPNILPLGSVTPDPVNPVNQSDSLPVRPPPHFGGSESLPLVPTHPPPLQQPAPRSNGIGTWPSNNTHVPVPSSGTLGAGCIPISNHQEEVPTVTCNVPLPHDFDVVTLFPDNHPQVLPHELATTLRKVLLPTPSSSSTSVSATDKTDEELELVFWENPDVGTSPSVHSSVEDIDDINSHQQNLPVISNSIHNEINQPHPLLSPQIPPRSTIIPPLFDTPHLPHPHTDSGGSHIPQSGHFPLMSFSPPQSANDRHPPIDPNQAYSDYKGGPLMPGSDPRRFHSIAPPLTQNVPPDPRQISTDPRYTRKESSHPVPQPFVSAPVSNTTRAPSSRIPIMPSSNIHPGSDSVLQSRPHSQPVFHSPIENNISSSSNDEENNKSQLEASPIWGSTHEPSSSAKSNDRIINPRQKYAHLKIKSKSGMLSLPPLTSALKKSATSQRENEMKQNLPTLLKDGKHLDKPISHQELFGSSSTNPSISLFGSSQQLCDIPESPSAVDKQGFGEIRLEEQKSETSVEKNNEYSPKLQSSDSECREEPPIPSYLTHLDLGISKDGENNSELKIDSAFGSLQARRRRLSEMSASISEETVSQDSLADKDQTPKMFSFGSSHY